MKWNENKKGTDALQGHRCRPLATVLFPAHRLGKPLFLEGEPGVGKTEAALVMSRLFETDLIRLQCYEGLDAATSLYEWNYPKQLLRREMETLARKAHCVIWLNPLAGDPDYEPVCRGMQTALPYVDYFLPADSLQSLKRVGGLISRILTR
ncbi:MAG: VWA domain-containing protein [Desulfatiglandaceae bacterium]